MIPYIDEQQYNLATDTFVDIEVSSENDKNDNDITSEVRKDLNTNCTEKGI